ncbi:MAG: FAD-dependent oxidoreductase [Clostridiales bacterium]|jgi:NADPH-dependent 2,4-dienoyl-CoA reductase/sulfur reductase-like enzyme/CxxC motif-containing protein|nr:FAD-dependent oxidoreductase [Clostridiales bacterium]
MTDVDLVIIGAGPAGMGAALAAKKHGINDIIILERADKTGGILPQCIHNGFGLHYFKLELTGPEYALRFARKIEEQNISVRLNTTVVNISPDKIVTAMSREEGVIYYKAKSIILAMGCRERTRGAIGIPGSRPAGVITAGAAQRFVNMEGYMPGKEIVILGSGDIGLIMARRLTLEGAHVSAVCEIMPQSGGLQRNISQCLNDFNIPLMLNTTVSKIHGEERVTGVTIAKVDEYLSPIKETEEYIACDTLMLSVGLIPENELSQSANVILGENGGAKTDRYLRTNVEGIFACGNVVHVHDLVDFVTQESEEAGKNAAYYLLNKEISGKGYVFVEKEIESKNSRPLQPNEKRLTCIVCPVGCRMSVFINISGNVTEVRHNTCPRGQRYAIEEYTKPRRVLTSTIKYNDTFVPVKTKGTIPKPLLLPAMRELEQLRLTHPAPVGTVVLSNLLETGVDVVLTDDVTDDPKN